MSEPLAPQYNPSSIESELYRWWTERGLFSPEAHAPGSGQPYVIMMPPPNVTAVLHMGHGLNNTVQDVLIRFERMRGRRALWLPGTDHAGIATQNVVERMLAQEGLTRFDLGREAFVERVWAFVRETGSVILEQLKAIGSSADWSRTYFTLDEGLSRAVREVFVSLYEQGLVYRGHYIINWCPPCLTALSNEEVEKEEVDGRLWHLRYPLADGSGHLTVATTRPETMLGDTAVAVHPDDERYKDLVGKHLILPLVGRRIPVVADEYADPETGSGAVKITPAHDFNDFEVGRRHTLEMINIFDADARINDNAPEAYRGLDRYKARDKVVADLTALGLVEKIDDHKLTLPYGDRSDVVIEPWLTDQWYCDAATLAKPAIKAVEEGRTVFVPKQWENTYFEWMRNIQPWCISRQLWWGHQIPAWYGPDGKVFVAYDEAEAQQLAHKEYGKAAALTRDPDVLDTWFSSGLWPFSTLGWPEQTPALKRYYPGDVLVTGLDIIFFWVARMMMLGIHFMGDVPFRTVYIHALVRDERGQKMSKSKGNVIDPLELIDKYGADALRFTMAALAAPGSGIKMSEQRVEGYRNFATKLWNATRFAEMNECKPVAGFNPSTLKEPVNRWIVGRLVTVKRAVEQAMAQYRYNDAASALYRFVWDEFCDWYVEFTKPVLQDTGEGGKGETRATTAWVIGQMLHLLHPFMPFITEELWEQMRGEQREHLITARWPDYADSLIDATIDADLDWVIRLVTSVRAMRAEMNIPPGPMLTLLLRDAGAATRARLEQFGDLVRRLARADKIETTSAEPPKGAAQIVLDEATIFVPLAGVIDIAQERARLSKELGKVKGEAEKIEKKLGNEQFLAKANPEVVAEQRQKLEDFNLAITKLTQALDRLTGL